MIAMMVVRRSIRAVPSENKSCAEHVTALRQALKEVARLVRPDRACLPERTYACARVA